MSNRLTFSLASLIVLMIAGFALLIPGTAKAAAPDFGTTTQADLTFTVDELVTGVVELPEAAPGEADDNVAYVLTVKSDTGNTAVTAISGLVFSADTRLLSGTPSVVSPENDAGVNEGPVYVWTAATAQADGTPIAADGTTTTFFDATAQTDSIEFKITIATDISFGTQTIDDIMVKVGDPVSVQLPEATIGSGDGTSLAYSLQDPDGTDITAAFSGLTFTAGSRLLAGRVDAVITEGEYTYIAAEVSADNGRAVLKFTISAATSSAPAFAATAEIDDISEMVGTTLMDGTNAYVLLPEASDADGDMLTYALTPATDGTPDLPDGLSLQHGALPGVAGMRHYIEGTITGVMAETEFTWTASDGDASTDDDTLTFDITTTAGAAPAAPTVMINDATDHENSLKIDVSWAAPTDGSASAVANYTLTQYDSDDMMVATFPAANAEKITGTMRQVVEMPASRGKSFTFKVVANYSAGMSPASAASSSVMIPMLAPDQPAKPRATANADLTINVMWDAPADTGGTAITGYIVKKYDSDGMVVKTFPADDPSTTAITGTSYGVGPVPSADRGMSFTFGVIAMNGTSETDMSEESAMSDSVMVPTAKPTPPVITSAAPNAVNKSITVAWNAPADPGGLPVTYTVNQTGVVTAQHDAGSATSYTITSLQPGAYTFTVTATNSKGSTPSAEAMATLPAPPTTTDNIGPTFGGKEIATIAATVDTAITAQILPQADDPDGDNNEITYELENLPNGLTFDDETRLLSGTPTAAQDATVYTYTATDEEGATASLKFIIQIAAIVPGAPGNVAATANQTANTISLTWDAPAKTGGTAITGYVVTMNGTAVTDDANTTDRMYTTSMLSAGDYAFTVAATNSAGTGAASSAVSATIHPEGANPTVTITAPADLDLSNLFTVTLTFSEAVSALAAADLTVTGGAVVGEPGKDATTNDGTVWKVVIDPDDGVTEVVIAVSANIASGTLSHTIKPPVEQTPGYMLAAGAYRVIVGSGFSDATLPGVTAMTQSDFPADLAAFFIAGGTVDVVATGGDVIINEFMVARDTSLIGVGNPTEGQWIELYNRSTTEAATITAINFHQVSPAPAQPNNLVDRLSNVVGQGWNFQGHFGADVLSGNPGDANTAAKNFISIRRKEPGKNGWTAGHWEKTPTTLTFAAARVGTPGTVNAPPTFAPTVNRTPARSSVTISEVANRMDDSNEWIELKGPAGKSLKNWKLSIATAVGTETTIFTFPNNDNIKISDNGRLLLTDQNPTANELAADYANGVVTPKRYKNAVVTLGALPNDGNFVLILRSNKDKTNHEAIEDIAGSPFNGDTNFLARAKPYTTLWPLTGNVGRLGKGNKLSGGKVYVRVRDIDGYSHNKDKPGETAFAAAGWTGIGYDRNAKVSDENGGTPGYPRGALQSRETTKDTAAANVPVVIINEIMYATGPRSNMPQWIELYNPSKTVGINMDGWRLTIINHDQDADGKTFAGDLSRNYAINSGRIPPGQTFLLTAYPGRDDTNLPDERIYDLPDKKRGDLILSQYGFEITLLTYGKDGKDENRKVVDKIGNLAEGADSRVRRNPQSYEDPAWALPVGTNDDGDRISIVRVSGKGDPIDGQKQGAWSRFDMSAQFTATVDATSYGHSTDIGSPGHTVGGVLPVSLSKFRPERLESGEVVIRWVTESELDNAGFNILRSETKDGEFTKLNTKLIAGKGTTSEKNTYEFVDTSAKPNVVYYYQIQDVSLDGDVTTLKTTHLRGNISVVGKLTTTWGELKALQ